LDLQQPSRRIAPEAQSPTRILIVRTGAMGDILHGMPAVAALRNALPDCEIGWAIEPHWSPLLRSAPATPHASSMPLVDRIHTVPTREWKGRPFSFATLRQIASLRRGLRAARYDVCVDLQGSIRSAFIGRISGSGRLVGASRPSERQARAFYNERVALKSVHVIKQACELVAAAAKLDHLDPLIPPFPLDPSSEAWCEALLRTHRSANGFVLLAPGAGWGAKRWPAASFARLARQLCDQGLVVLANTSSDSAVDAELAAAGAAPIQCSFPQLMALVRRSALVIGGDTGPVHLAAAMGRPVVSLFGPTDPARTGPDFPAARKTVLRHHASVEDHRRRAITEAGLAQITVSEVLAAALTMLAVRGQQEPVDG
jgi:heptosyltransferase-1